MPPQDRVRAVTGGAALVDTAAAAAAAAQAAKAAADLLKRMAAAAAASAASLAAYNLQLNQMAARMHQAAAQAQAETIAWIKTHDAAEAASAAAAAVAPAVGATTAVLAPTAALLPPGSQIINPTTSSSAAATIAYATADDNPTNQTATNAAAAAIGAVAADVARPPDDDGQCNDSDGTAAAKKIVLPSDRWNEAVQHAADRIGEGQGTRGTIDRAGAAARRRESLRGIKTVPGLDRDEWPMAMFKEGGKGASVRLINPSDNRGLGSYVKNQCRDLPNDSVVEFIVGDS